MDYNTDDWNSEGDNEGWEEDDDLCYDFYKLNTTLVEKKEELTEDDFWKCGNCDYDKNKIYRSTCLMCSMPQLDIITTIISEDDKNITKCKRCNSFLLKEFLYSHYDKCLPLVTEIQENDKWKVDLTVIQKNVLKNMHTQSKKLSEKYHNNLVKKIVKLGYQESDLIQLHNFIIWKLPMTIRFRYNTLKQFFIKDTHYRSLFETNKGNGNNDQKVRAGWERRMFGDFYDNGEPYERPKYGCFNVTMSKKGCTKAIGYGECYFVLNDNTTRWRITFCTGDSAGLKDSINYGTINHCFHVLNKFSEEDLKNIIEVSKGNEGQEHKNYREIQIHGDVKFNRDIKMMYVPKKYMEDIYVNEFCINNGIILCSI